MTTVPAEHEATKTGIHGEIAGNPVTVPPVKEWRASALDLLTDGRFTSWAESVLSDEDFDKWADADPTVGEVETFFESISKDLGLNPGNSRNSGPSSRSTRKR